MPRSRAPTESARAAAACCCCGPSWATVALRKNATPAQIALAWLLAQKPWIVPVPGTSKLSRLDENLGAANVQLTPEDLRAIDTAAAKIRVKSTRYPEELEKTNGL